MDVNSYVIPYVILIFNTDYITYELNPYVIF